MARELDAEESRTWNTFITVLLTAAHVMISYDVKERLTSGLPIRAVRNRSPRLNVLDSDGVLEEGVDVVGKGEVEEGGVVQV